MTKIYLHLNGLALLTACTLIYGLLGFHWGLYAVLILAPDIFMLGYLVNPSVGAKVYNLGHSLVWPAALIVSGLLMSFSILIAIGIIWACHISLDHTFGYGYKYPDAFRHTHFTEV